MRSTTPIRVLRFEVYHNPLDPDHDGKLLLQWTWSNESGGVDVYWLPNLDHWEVWPSYSYLDSNNTVMWADLSSETVNQVVAGTKQWDFYWDIPVNAEDIHFRLRPISKPKEQCENGMPFEEEYFSTENKYFGGSVKPDAPSTPSVTQDSYLGTTAVLGLENVSLEGNNIYVTKVEFQCIVFNSDDPMEVGTVSRTLEALIDEFGNAKTTVGIGNAYGFKFRARLCSVKVKHGDGADDPIVVRSDWSEMTEMLYGVCKKPKLKVNKFSSTQVEYTIETTSYAYSYQLEMAPDTSCFVKMDEWERENPQYKRDSEQRKAAADRFGIVAEWFHEPDAESATVATKNWVEDVLSVARDLAYYRARSLSAQNNGFFSPWSTVDDESTLSFSDGLRAPIVWNATEFAVVDDPSIQLSVMHNSPNGSPSCLCVIYYGINDMPSPQNRIDVLPPQGQQNGNVIYNVNFDLTGFDEETVIYWKAVTYEGGAAIAANCSPWSEIISFAVHEKPGLTVRIKDIRENAELNRLPVVGTYPIKYVTETTYFDSHYNEILVTSMSFKVLSRQSYRRLDRYGNPVVIKAGDVLYSIIDVEDPRDKERTIAASDITLDNGVWYTLEATVTLNNGSSAVDVFDFTVDMGAKDYIIECTGSVNPNDVSLNLIPSAVKYEGTGLITPGDPIPLGSDDLLWVANGKLYCSYNKVYDPETGVISDTGWDMFVDGYALVSNMFWQAEDGRILGYAGNFGTIFNEETGEWERDTRDTFYGTSEPMFRAKLCDTDSYWYDVLFRTETSGFGPMAETSVVMAVYESDDWIDVPEESITSVISGSVVGEYIWHFTNNGQTRNILSNGYEDYMIDVNNVSGLTINITEITSYFSRHLNGIYIWNAGDRVFYSNYDNYELTINNETGEYTWVRVEFGGIPDVIYGNHIVTINGVAYTTYEGYLYSLDLDTMTWNMINGNGGSSELVRVLAQNVTLSVYRKNDDGTFVPIAENIDNTTGMNVTDPHPNLGGANYRIVATDMESGAQTFYDPPPYDMKCTDIILQWDEYYASKPNDGRDTELPEMGNMVRLPYNVDVSETANMESEMVSYIGRANPVSYYGTQTGYTASWSTEIPKYDKETIRMLRKLQVFPGDVYVREPNGTGYWARVTVTFPINHLALTVSVSISITRVEGGV